MPEPAAAADEQGRRPHVEREEREARGGEARRARWRARPDARRRRSRRASRRRRARCPAARPSALPRPSIDFMTTKTNGERPDHVERLDAGRAEPRARQPPRSPPRPRPRSAVVRSASLERSIAAPDHGEHERADRDDQREVTELGSEREPDQRPERDQRAGSAAGPAACSAFAVGSRRARTRRARAPRPPTAMPANSQRLAAEAATAAAVSIRSCTRGKVFGGTRGSERGQEARSGLIGVRSRSAVRPAARASRSTSRAPTWSSLMASRSRTSSASASRVGPSADRLDAVQQAAVFGGAVLGGTDQGLGELLARTEAGDLDLDVVVRAQPAQPDHPLGRARRC